MLGYSMVRNYLIGREAKRLCQSGRRVVIDGYYVATIVDFSKDTTYSVHADSYTWPSDLLKPTVVFHLCCPSNSVVLTEMNNDLRFQNQCSIYQALGCVEISTEGGFNEIVERMLSYLREELKIMI